MIEIRTCRDGDEGAIRDLFALCFGKELLHEEWIWKYKSSYLGSSSFVAEEDGKVIAHYGGFKLLFYSRGRIFHAYQGCDVMTHPKYRAKLFSRKGVIVQTAEKFYEANPMEFIFGFPSERHGRLQSLQLGFERHRYITVLKKERKYFRHHRSSFLRVETGWERIRPDEMDDIWTNTRDSLPLSIEKTSGYILWRYRDNPRGGYELLTVRGFLKKALKAYVIFKVEKDVLCVLDFFILQSAVLKKLLAILEDLAIKRSAKYISFWCNPVEGFFEEFKINGYIEENGIPYIVKAFRESSISPEFFLKSYCFRQGDYDAA
jgi:hypothetical protein